MRQCHSHDKIVIHWVNSNLINAWHKSVISSSRKPEVLVTRYILLISATAKTRSSVCSAITQSSVGCHEHHQSHVSGSVGRTGRAWRPEYWVKYNGALPFIVNAARPPLRRARPPLLLPSLAIDRWRLCPRIGLAPTELNLTYHFLTHFMSAIEVVYCGSPDTVINIPSINCTNNFSGLHALLQHCNKQVWQHSLPNCLLRFPMQQKLDVIADDTFPSAIVLTVGALAW